MDPLRSLLFVPGNRADMLEKARSAPADALIPDMEDSVPLGEKERARETIAAALPSLSQRSQKIVVRTNSLGTGLLEEDLTAVIGPRVYGVVLTKVESPWEVHQAAAIMEGLERRTGLEPGTIKLIPLVETALGLIHTYDIARASPRVVAVTFGADDYLTDMGIQRAEEGHELDHPRQVIGIAARAAGVLSLDTPYVNFRDPQGLEADCRRALSMGFKGKFAIHPGQIEIINTMFSPSPEEVEYARRVVAAFEEAERQGRGSTSLEGKMIDVPAVTRAQNLLALAKAIARRGG